MRLIPFVILLKNILFKEEGKLIPYKGSYQGTQCTTEKV